MNTLKKIARLLLVISLSGVAVYPQQEMNQENKSGNELANDIPKEIKQNVFDEAIGKVFRWKLQKKDILELRKIGDQTIKLQGRQINRKVYHRVTLETKEIDPDWGYLMEGTFSTSIRPVDKKVPYEEQEYYQGSFFLSPRGFYKLNENDYMPNIRSLPAFPRGVDPAGEGVKKMPAGYRWRLAGEEAIKSTAIIRIPFDVQYEYRGSEIFRTNEGDKEFQRFTSSYQINYENNSNRYPNVPSKMYGFVGSNWLWDSQKGIPYISTEEYNVIMVYPNGETREFQINTTSFYRKIKEMPANEKKETMASLQKSLSKTKGVKIKTGTRGIEIEIPDILFKTGSSKLYSDAKEIIENIARGLPKKLSHGILVRGHTDSVGSDEDNKILSLNRAKSVAEYLFDECSYPSEQIKYEGLGSKEPVADNATNEGRSKNRRVEIIVLYK